MSCNPRVARQRCSAGPHFIPTTVVIPRPRKMMFPMMTSQRMCSGSACSQHALTHLNSVLPTQASTSRSMRSYSPNRQHSLASGQLRGSPEGLDAMPQPSDAPALQRRDACADRLICLGCYRISCSSPATGVRDAVPSHGGEDARRPERHHERGKHPRWSPTAAAEPLCRAWLRPAGGPERLQRHRIDQKT